MRLSSTVLAANPFAKKSGSKQAQLTAPVDQLKAIYQLYVDRKYLDAIELGKKITSRFPNDFQIWKILGACYENQGLAQDAYRAMEKSLQINPKDGEGWGNIGKVYRDLGRLAEATASYQKALEINPDDHYTRVRYIYLLNYLNEATPEDMFAEAVKLGDSLSKVNPAPFDTWAVTQDKTPERLRVGLLSGDFAMHPVGFFLDNVLTHLKRLPIDIYAYHNRPDSDLVTTSLISTIDHWHDTTKMDDAQVTELVASHQLHILLDLSGLTAHNRLHVLARKPAPIQISWLGYFATTGLKSMDYILVSPHDFAETQRPHFVEKPLFLPHTRLCYGGRHLPPVQKATVNDAPVLTNKFMTFGCVQHMSKIGADVLQVWAKILTQLPNAKVRIQNAQMGTPSELKNFIKRCVDLNISLDQIECLAQTKYDEYLMAYREIDLVLDTFPFPGGTTTCEALWMGVPTISLTGDTLIARQGESLLNAAGMSDWVCKTTDEYIQKAIYWAEHPIELNAFRLQCRSAVLKRPLFDAQLFARDLSALLFKTWAQHFNSP